MEPMQQINLLHLLQNVIFIIFFRQTFDLELHLLSNELKSLLYLCMGVDLPNSGAKIVFNAFIPFLQCPYDPVMQLILHQLMKLKVLIQLFEHVSTAQLFINHLYKFKNLQMSFCLPAH